MKERRKRNVKFTLKAKISIINESANCGNIRSIARKYNIYPQQIRQWKRDRNKFMNAIQRNPKVKTIHPGKPIEKINVETDILTWIKELRDKDIAISTRQVIAKALSLDSEFHNGNTNALWSWVYVFLQRK
jgi:transposase-like protein